MKKLKNKKIKEIILTKIFSIKKFLKNNIGTYNFLFKQILKKFLKNFLEKSIFEICFFNNKTKVLKSFSNIKLYIKNNTHF